MKPIISIIVPVYNVENHLRKCLDSLLAQTLTNFEVIVVNDGSTDRSGKICDEYSVKDMRIKVIQKENGGLSSARNVGIKAAEGQYIGFVDGDDRIDVNMYENLYRQSIDTKSDISVCTLGREIDGTLVNEEKEKLVKEMDNVEAMRELFKGDLYRFSVCNKLFKKHCFENVQFPEGRIHEDLSTTYRLFANSNKTVFNNHIGYIYVKRKDSILTSQFSEKRLDSFTGWNEILLFMNKKYPQLYSEILAAFTFWCVDNMYYIINQVETKEKKREYLNVIQKNVKKNYISIMKNYDLSLKYKYLITLINYNVDLMLFMNKLKKLM
ncbi:glycosyltransferase family 2 protein [Jeotgalibacillus marinus]|uniref:Glycosyltransferase n=1 Tax=Jeotgalibacillus marinus TaxID=86667 RepID=A0ABV3Q2K2_9BACL